jgi:hypothetical protein
MAKSKAEGDTYTEWIADIDTQLNDKTFPSVSTLQATVSAFTGEYIYNAGYNSVQGFNMFCRMNNLYDGFFIVNVKNEIHDDRTKQDPAPNPCTTHSDVIGRTTYQCVTCQDDNSSATWDL